MTTIMKFRLSETYLFICMFPLNIVSFQQWFTLIKIYRQKTNVYLLKDNKKNKTKENKCKDIVGTLLHRLFIQN